MTSAVLGLDCHGDSVPSSHRVCSSATVHECPLFRVFTHPSSKRATLDDAINANDMQDEAEVAIQARGAEAIHRTAVRFG